MWRFARRGLPGALVGTLAWQPHARGRGPTQCAPPPDLAIRVRTKVGDLASATARAGRGDLADAPQLPFTHAAPTQEIRWSQAVLLASAGAGPVATPDTFLGNVRTVLATIFPGTGGGPKVDEVYLGVHSSFAFNAATAAGSVVAGYVSFEPPLRMRKNPKLDWAVPGGGRLWLRKLGAPDTNPRQVSALAIQAADFAECGSRVLANCVVLHPQGVELSPIDASIAYAYLHRETKSDDAGVALAPSLAIMEERHFTWMLRNGEARGNQITRY